MSKWGLLQEFKLDLTLKKLTLSLKTKRRKNMIILMCAKKEFDEMQYLVSINTADKIGLKQKFLNLVKCTY